MFNKNPYLKFCLIPVFSVLLGIGLQAQFAEPTDMPEYGAGGSVPMSIYSDNIAMKLRLETQRWRKDTYVVIDYAQTNAFEIQSCVLGTLRFGENEETIKVMAENFKVEVHRDEIAVAPDLICNTLSAEYAEENNQIDVAAKIGWPILKNYSLRLDFDSQTLVMTPAAERTEADARAEFELVITGLQQINDEVLVPVAIGDNQYAYMQIDTSTYHTRIDRNLAEELGYPSEDSASIEFASSDQRSPVSEMAALMTVDLTSEEDDIKQMAAGLSLLTGYDLEINPKQGFLALSQITNSNYREPDAIFYAAMRAADRHALDAFLDSYPEDRNVEEAVLNRFVLGVEVEDDVEIQMASLEKGLNVTKKSEKFRYLNDFLGIAVNMQAHPDLGIAVGERSLEFVSVAQNPGDRNVVQLMVGDLYMDQDNIDEAHRNYFAASFNGDPRMDGIMKFKMATVYEAQKRWTRAYSKYAGALKKQRSLPEGIAAAAQEGLSRIRPMLDPDDPLIKETENLQLYVAKAINVGEALPVVTANNLEGVEQSLADYQGKVVLIDVWATWCGPCLAGLPKLREVAEQFEGTDFVVLSVSADDQAQTVKDFLKDEEMPWDHWHIGASSEVHEEWSIRGYPTYMLIDRDGTLLSREHALTEDMISEMQKLLIQI